MKSSTRVLLILLRLAIGWHFFIEGVSKIESVQRGPTTAGKPWTSEPYLLESSGPFGAYFRHSVGDPDEAALARLEVQPLAEGEDPNRVLLHLRMPPALAQDWDRYFDRFVAHYQLDQKQTDLARKHLKQAEDNAVTWLLQGKKQVKKPLHTTTVEVEEATPARVAAYRKQVERVRAMQDQELPAFGADVLKEQLRSAKAEARRMRTELMADLDEQTAQMKAGLYKAVETTLTPEQKAKGPVPEEPAARPVERIDQVTMYGLTIVGACLLLGLFTRTACVLAAGFLLMIYLSMPPFPGVPENLKAEGHYLFVNKNLIEMLALLALATTSSGRWLGLDALLQFLRPRRWRRPTDDAIEARIANPQ